MANRLFLIDGSGFIFRAYYAIRRLSTSKGVPTNAVTGFANMIQKLLREQNPTHVGVIFDTKAPTFRHELYPEYKANRTAPPEDLIPQFALVRQLVDAYRWKRLEMPGFEADDIIATLAEQAKAQGYEVVIVSSDKDLCQLLDEKVRMYDTMKDKWTGPGDLKERFGGGPESVLDVLALAGDASDNIPGAPGVGEKTAVKLLSEFGSLKGILDRAADIPGKLGEKIRENKDKILLSHELATLKRDLDLGVAVEDFRAAQPDREALVSLLTELEMTRLLEGVRTEPPAKKEPVPRESPKKTADAQQSMDFRPSPPPAPAAPAELPPEFTEGRLILVSTRDELACLVRKLQNAKEFAFDLATTDPDAPMSAHLVGLAFCVEEAEAYYIPVAHRYLGAPAQIPAGEAVAAFKPVFEDPGVLKTGHDLKFSRIVLKRHGVDLAGAAFDTMIGDYLLHPETGEHRLDQLSQRFLGRPLASFKDLVKEGRKTRLFDEIPVEQARDFAAQNARVAGKLSGLLRPRLEREGVTKLMNDIEMPLAAVLAEMESAGVLIDRDFFRSLSRESERELARLETKIQEQAGTSFNINSPKQVAEILYVKLGLPSGKKTEKKTGLSTDVAALEAIEGLHPVPKLILEYRAFHKLKSTYIDALPMLINPATGRLHTRFNQCVAATGRLSSSDPNLQNIPIRTPEGRRIREGFVAPPGRILLSADYSQVELRLLAHLSKDEAMIDAFRHGADIHRTTAAKVFGVAEGEVTDAMRREAKTINFGIVYGMSAFRLGRDLEIGTKKGQEFIDAYFDRFPGVRAFIERTIAEARRTGFVTTMMGRRRPIPELQSRNRNEVGFGERTAVNTPLQGSAADIIKMAMVHLGVRLAERRLPATPILQVHDELLLEVDEGRIEEAKELVRETMEHVIELEVPLLVETSFGRNWSSAH